MRSLRGRAAQILAALALAVGLIAGCGEAPPAAAGPASKPTPTAPPVPSASVRATPVPTTTRMAAASHVGYLSGVAVGEQSRYDRVVFTFSQEFPGYAVGSYPALLQVRAAGDFESYLSLGIGLSQRAGFRVFTLTQPYRVVIDVAHRN